MGGAVKLEACQAVWCSCFEHICYSRMYALRSTHPSCRLLQGLQPYCMSQPTCR